GGGARRPPAGPQPRPAGPAESHVAERLLPPQARAAGPGCARRRSRARGAPAAAARPDAAAPRGEAGDAPRGGSWEHAGEATARKDVAVLPKRASRPSARRTGTPLGDPLELSARRAGGSPEDSRAAPRAGAALADGGVPALLGHAMTVPAMLWLKDRVGRHRPRSEGEDDDVETACIRSHGVCGRSSSITNVGSWESLAGDRSEVSEHLELAPAHSDRASEAALQLFTEGARHPDAPSVPGHGGGVISLDKRRGPIGVVVSGSSGVPRVSKITGGLVAEWNNHHPHCKVSAGDTILEVNGVRGDPIAMLTELARGPDVVRLLVLPGLQPAGATQS
ncbi:unnamed protein product, partial [Prorocentrum cordatum]